MQVGKSVGRVTLDDALLELVTKKLVAPGEALSKAVDKAGFESALKRVSPGADVLNPADRLGSSAGRTVPSPFRSLGADPCRLHIPRTPRPAAADTSGRWDR